MHRRHTTTLCPPQLLENRCLMAGDVTLSLSGGVLTVQGDSGTNRVTIEGAPLGVMPTLHVVRVSSSDGSTGLVFNGQRTTELTVSGVTRLDVIPRW